MKNLLKLSTLLFAGLILILVSCDNDSDTPDPIPDPSGSWRIVSATLIDGNADTPEADPLVIANLQLADIPDGPIPIDVNILPSWWQRH